VAAVNALGVPDTDLGPKWMLPFDAHFAVSGAVHTLYDADGTARAWTKSGSTYSADREADTLSDNGTDYTLVRFNGDKWVFSYLTGKLARIESRTGHQIAIDRDGNGRITKITDGQARETIFLYTTMGGMTRLSEIREPAPGDVGWYSTFFQFDSSGRLVAIVNALGETTRFEWDANARLWKAIDGHGHATEYSYDSSGRVTNVKDAAGKNTVFAYDDVNRTRTVTNRLSKSTVYAFDVDGRVTSVEDALANKTEYIWDATTWELTRVAMPKIDPGGSWRRQRVDYGYGTTTATQHELWSRKTTLETGAGPVTLQSEETWTYNAFHDVLTYRDAENVDKAWTNPTLAYTYKEVSGSSIGLVETVKNGENQTVQTNAYEQISGKWRLWKITNGAGKVWEFKYDQNQSNSFGNPDRVINPSGASTDFKIDVRGRTYEETGPSGNPMKTEFDALDRVTRVTNPDGSSFGTVYSCCHVAAEYDENGRGSTFDYDAMGRLVKTIDENGNETTRVYNDEGWLTSLTDPRGKTTSMSYDDIGRLLETNYPGNWRVQLTYFEPGMLKSKANSKLGGSSSTVLYEIDDLLRLKRKDFPSGTDTEYEYLKNGLVSKMKDASGEKRYTYDKANRLTKIEQGPTGFVVGTDHNYVQEHAWNAADQRTQMKLTLRGGSAQTWDFTYKDDGELATVVFGGETTTHDYLSDGRLKKISLPNGATREVFYQDTDSAQAYVSGKNPWLRRILDKKSGGATIVDFQYELDRAGRVVGLLDKDSRYFPTAYDPADRVVSESRWSAKANGTRGYQRNYAYDPGGNRIRLWEDGAQIVANFGEMGELTSFGLDAFTTDHFGNTKTQMSGLTTTTFNWDFESRLIGIDYPNSANDDSHEYDGNGLRMRSKLGGAADWTNFVWDEVGGDLIAEYTLVSGTYTLRSLNVWGQGLLWTDRQGTKRYYHFDGEGSTRALTDSSQNVTETYEYTSFGELIAATGAAVNSFRWKGQTGAYDDLARGCLFPLTLFQGAHWNAETATWLNGILALRDDAGPGIQRRQIEIRFGPLDPYHQGLHV
jgi:YD repeat-containing protein